MRVICRNTHLCKLGCRHSEEHFFGEKCTGEDIVDVMCVCTKAGIEHDIDIKSLELAACSRKGLWLGGKGDG